MQSVCAQKITNVSETINNYLIELLVLRRSLLTEINSPHYAPRDCNRREKLHDYKSCTHGVRCTIYSTCLSNCTGSRKYERTNIIKIKENTWGTNKLNKYLENYIVYRLSFSMHLCTEKCNNNV